MWNMCGTCEEMEARKQVLIDRSNYVMERNPCDQNCQEWILQPFL